MYPGGELARLARQKEFLRARIAVRREECCVAAHELARPLAWVDQAIDRWRAISPLVRVVGVPLIVLAARKFLSGGGGKWLAMARTLPVIFRAARAYTHSRT